MDERIQKYFQGELSPSERLEFLKEVEADDTLMYHFIEVQNIRGLVNLSPKAENRLQGKESYNQFVRQKMKQKNHHLVFHLLKYAAIAVVLIVSSSLLTLNFTQSYPETMATNSMFVPAGQRARVTLQDGTVVWLNAKSTLTYPSQFEGKERKVIIEGEAFFDVAKDASKPFIVMAGDVEMKVLGTKFNVYNYPEAGFIQTSLIEGSVQVRDTHFAAEGVILKPNEQVTVTGNELIVGRITFPDHFLWKEGVYCFEKESFPEIVKKLEIYYDVKIVIDAPTLMNEVYTGKFRQRDGIDDILRILQQIHAFRVEKDKVRNVITLRK